MAQQPPVVQGRLIIEASQSQSDTPQSVGLLWTSDQPVAEASTWQLTALITDIHAAGGIRTLNRSRRGAPDRAATGIGYIMLKLHRMLLYQADMDESCRT